MALVDKIALLKNALDVVLKIVSVMSKCIEFVIDSVEK